MQQNQITSIIDNCNIMTAFNRVIKFYDPNKSKNRKTKVLDLSSFFSWAEADYVMFDVTKTRNLDGSVLNHKYDIIIYEPPCNKTFFANALEFSKTFTKILNIGGNIIVKLHDFKENMNGNNELKGTFDLKTIFESNEFYLQDQIIYRNRQSFTPYNNNSNFEVVHLYFMVFKKKIPT